MSIPSHVEAAAILRGLQPSERLLTHSAAVAEVCAFLCAGLSGRGVVIDTALAEAAALLHDIDKALPADDPLRSMGHGAAGAEWMRRNGHPELAEAIAHHPVTTLADPRGYAAWAGEAGLEGRVVAYADKRATQDLVTLDQRFERWYRRYPDSPLLRVTHERARTLEKEVCGAAGIEPADVRRLAWVDDALSAAAAA
jgi:putative nucleotidyltransferase with HDIG domain